MKKNKTTLLLVLFFFLGLFVLLYPTLSNLYNEKVQSKAIVDYEALLSNINTNEYLDMIEEAEDYNNRLRALERPFYTHKTLKDYHDVLNVGGTGMMGYINIDKIGVELPIYHGTTEEVLSIAVGHVEGSSLPIGGVGTHSVLSAHRGLPSSKLFTDLDKLEIGDMFTISILDRELTYLIDNIVIVNPDEIENLEIDVEKDYVTLVTCTPYGINTHRLLVRGVRIENTEKPVYISTEAFKISNMIVTPLVATPIILSSLFMIAIKPVKKKKNYMDKYLYPSKNKKQLGGKEDGKKR